MSALWRFIPTVRSTYPLRTSPEAQWTGAKSCTITCKKLALRHCFCPDTWMICHPLWKMPNYWTQLWAGVLLKKNKIIAGYHTQVQAKMRKTYLQVNGDHKKPSHLTASGHRETFLWVFAAFFGIKPTGAALGWCTEPGLSISRNESGWCWVERAPSRPGRGAQEQAELTDRSKEQSDHVSCSWRPLGRPAYSLRATWSHTAVNASLAGLRRSLRTLS